MDDLICENRPARTGEPCGRPASWLVGVGSRISDRQLCCGRCLNQVCVVIVAAEGRDNVKLTVIPLN